MFKLFKDFKVVGMMIFGLFVLSFAQAAQAANTDTCRNFSRVMHFNQEKDFRDQLAWAKFYGTDVEINTINGYINNARADVSALQDLLSTKENISISDSEKKTKTFGPSTASAVTRFQEKYASDILTPQALTHGIGYVDSYTVKTLNQKFGCIDKAVIDLTSPNGQTVKARGEVLAITWTASKIPNQATLNINYIKADGTATTSIATTTISNGKGSYNWTIPNTMVAGIYKVQLVISGSVKADLSAKAFEIRETALQVLSPNGGETLSVSDKFEVKWKTSSLIKPTDTLSLRMTNVPADSNASAKLYQIATVKNTGSYKWTVPEKLDNQTIANGGQYKISLITTDGSLISDVSDAYFTIAKYEKLLTLTTVFSNTPVGMGSDISVNWTYANIPDNTPVVVKLLKVVSSGSANDVVESELVNKGLVIGDDSKTVRIPEGLTAGAKYKIQIVAGEFSSKSNAFDVAAKAIPVPVISLTSLTSAQSIERGSDVKVDWTSNSAVPAKAKMDIVLVNSVGESVVSKLKTGWAANANSATVQIPASTAIGAYKIILVPTGVTLTSASVLKSAVITVTAQNASFSTLTTDSEVMTGDKLAVSFTTSSNMPSKNQVTIKILNSNDSATAIPDIKVAASTLGSSIAIPANFAPGQYKAYATTVVDGQVVTKPSSLFTVKAKPAPTATFTINGKSDATVKVGESITYNWGSTDADSATSSYTSNCGNNAAWIVKTVSGTVKIPAVAATQVGCSYNIKFNVKQASSGATAIAGAKLTVVKK